MPSAHRASPYYKVWLYDPRSLTWIDSRRSRVRAPIAGRLEVQFVEADLRRFLISFALDQLHALAVEPVHLAILLTIEPGFGRARHDSPHLVDTRRTSPPLALREGFCH